MPYFPRDGLSFHYRDTGEGLPFVFQHGLGGDVEQPFGLLQPPPPGVRLLAFDCRGHGQTRPLGDPAKIGIASFADDLAAFLDFLRLDAIVLGGISMGAAIALNFAVRFPQRVRGLVLSRPAWLDQPTPTNVRVFGLIARLIREHGAEGGLDIFRESPEYQQCLRESPDAAESLVKQFQHSRAEETVVKLERIPNDAPLADLNVLQSIAVPTLVLANRKDPIHPFAFGETLVKAIPGAEFAELTPKSVNVDRHAADVRQHICRFFRQRFPAGNNDPPRS